MTVNVTRISAGQAGAAYLLNGHGCERAKEGPEGYYLRGAEVGPVGRWWGEGLGHLGLAAGAEVAEADVRAVFGYLAHPAVMRAAEERIREDGLEGKAAEAVREQAAAAGRLGNEPYQFRSLEDRVAERLQAEGISAASDPERAEQIRIEEAGKNRSAAGFYDITFSHGKSTSLYYAGLLAAGRTEEAAAFKACHDEAVDAALSWLAAEAGYVRTGHHGKGKDGRPSVGRYITAGRWTVAVFDHLTNRNGEPQLHSHAAVLSRARITDTDGEVKYRNLDSRAITRARLGAAAVYESELEQRAMARFPVVYRMRPDGKGRELLGITEAERKAFSSRRAKVTEQVDEWAADYERRHGYKPSAYARTVMAQAAALHTRDPKQTAGSEAELHARWERMAGQRLAGSLAHLAERADSAGITARVAEAGNAGWDRAGVITAGLGAVQEKRATWSAAELSFHIGQALPEGAEAERNRAELIAELTTEALSAGEVVQVRGLELIEIPAELRRPEDGRSIYRPGRDERYSLLSHLQAEEQTAAHARNTGAPALTPEQADAAIATEAAGGLVLNDDQAAAVRGVLTDGHWISVVRGVAGAGKTTAQGVAGRAWTQRTGGRVLGLATSARAADELRAAGVGQTANTTKFLLLAAGIGPRAEVERWQLRPGDLVIVDEAGMTSTSHLAQITRLADDAGAKVVPVGDEGQLPSVDAGGLFRQLANDPRIPLYELGTVRRFTEADGTVRDWEAEASKQLREGDPAALTAYAAHGRIKGGTAEEMAAEIRHGYVADALAGRAAAVMAGTEEKAAELADAIRADLVALGLAEADGVPLRDGNVAGVGDLVQARDNNHQLTDSKGDPVLNRWVYRVTARDETGSLTARRITGRDEQGNEKFGGTVRFPARYVREEITLGFAGTTYAEQGSTKVSGYEYADRTTSREALYTGLTRGQGNNRVFVETARAADEHQAEELDSDPLTELAAALSREQAERSASDTLREELEWQESLPASAPIWDDLVAEHTRRQYGQVLEDALGGELAARLQGEDPASVYRLLREAELAGHDVHALAAGAAAGRSLEDADNLAALYYWRLQRQLGERQPEREPAGPGWLERTPNIPGPVGDYARARAAAQDARREELAAQAAADPPEWAQRTLGPVPADPADRLEWERRAGLVAAYRERYHLQDTPGTIIGPAPAAGLPDQAHEWRAASDALGRTPEEQQLAAASDGQLQEMTSRWEREQAWAPPHVADDLASTIQARDYHTEQAAILARRAELASDPAERDELAGQARGYQVLGEQLASQARQYEQIHAARLAWTAETAPAKDAAEAARAEQARRQADQQACQPAAATQREPAGHEPATVPAAAEEEQAAAAVRTATEYEQDLAHEPGPDAEADVEQDPRLRDLTAALQAAREAVEKIHAREAERAAQEQAEREREQDYHRPGPYQQSGREAERDGPELEP